MRHPASTTPMISSGTPTRRSLPGRLRARGRLAIGCMSVAGSLLWRIARGPRGGPAGGLRLGVPLRAARRRRPHCTDWPIRSAHDASACSSTCSLAACAARCPWDSRSARWRLPALRCVSCVSQRAGTRPSVDSESALSHCAAGGDGQARNDSGPVRAAREARSPRDSIRQRNRGRGPQPDDGQLRSSYGSSGRGRTA